MKMATITLRFFILFSFSIVIQHNVLAAKITEKCAATIEDVNLPNNILSPLTFLVKASFASTEFYIATKSPLLLRCKMPLLEVKKIPNLCSDWCLDKPFSDCVPIESTIRISFSDRSKKYLALLEKNSDGNLIIRTLKEPGGSSSEADPEKATILISSTFTQQYDTEKNKNIIRSKIEAKIFPSESAYKSNNTPISILYDEQSFQNIEGPTKPDHPTFKSLTNHANLPPDMVCKTGECINKCIKISDYLSVKQPSSTIIQPKNSVQQKPGT